MSNLRISIPLVSNVLPNLNTNIALDGLGLLGRCMGSGGWADGGGPLASNVLPKVTANIALAGELPAKRLLLHWLGSFQKKRLRALAGELPKKVFY